MKDEKENNVRNENSMTEKYRRKINGSDERNIKNEWIIRSQLFMLK